jgi:hypothetical protein
MEYTVFILNCTGLCTAAVNIPTCVNSDFPFYFLKFVCNVGTFLYGMIHFKLYANRKHILYVT